PNNLNLNVTSKSQNCFLFCSWTPSRPCTRWGEDDACDECLMGPRPEQDLGGRGTMDLHDDKRSKLNLLELVSKR
ncbi:hypothetical protein AVEN_250085-1, partial [Araneus ventricosus]